MVCDNSSAVTACPFNCPSGRGIGALSELEFGLSVGGELGQPMSRDNISSTDTGISTLYAMFSPLTVTFPARLFSVHRKVNSISVPGGLLV